MFWFRHAMYQEWCIQINVIGFVALFVSLVIIIIIIIIFLFLFFLWFLANLWQDILKILTLIVRTNIVYFGPCSRSPYSWISRIKRSVTLRLWIIYLLFLRSLPLVVYYSNASNSLSMFIHARGSSKPL